MSDTAGIFPCHYLRHTLTTARKESELDTYKDPGMFLLVFQRKLNSNLSS